MMSRREVETVNPYGGSDDKSRQVEQMFDSIAPAYDFMNRAMTLGIDKCWRRVAVNSLRDARPRHVLDLATGTGDFALALLRRLSPERVTGVDLSAGMLDVARRKAEQRGVQDKVTFLKGDCLDLPLEAASVDAVTIAFGVRNFADLDRGYREMARVMKGGARLVVLELSTPVNPIIRWFYKLYAMHIIPFIGGLKSGDREAYRYLPRSIAAVPQADDMLELMRLAGFENCRYRHLTLGTCTLYTAVKP